MRRCRLINREVAGSEGQRSPSLLLLPPPPTSSLLCSLPGANELLMAAEPLINSPSLPPSPSCPPVLPLSAPSSRPPGRAPSSLAPAPHCLSAHFLVRIFFFLLPLLLLLLLLFSLLPHHPLSVFNHFSPPHLSLWLSLPPSLPPSFLFSALSFLLP